MYRCVIIQSPNSDWLAIILSWAAINHLFSTQYFHISSTVWLSG